MAGLDPSLSQLSGLLQFAMADDPPPPSDPAFKKPIGLKGRPMAAPALPAGFQFKQGAMGLWNVHHSNGALLGQGATQDEALANAMKRSPEHFKTKPDKPTTAKWSAEMEKQYKEFRRGGAAGPPDNRTLWIDEFVKRLKEDLK